MEWESIFVKDIFARNSLKCPDQHRKLMFGNLTIRKGWAQFTKIFVLNTALFCTLDLNLPTLCDDVGNQAT